MYAPQHCLLDDCLCKALKLDIKPIVIAPEPLP